MPLQGSSARSQRGLHHSFAASAPARSPTPASAPARTRGPTGQPHGHGTLQSMVGHSARRTDGAKVNIASFVREDLAKKQTAPDEAASPQQTGFSWKRVLGAAGFSGRPAKSPRSNANKSPVDEAHTDRHVSYGHSNKVPHGHSSSTTNDQQLAQPRRIFGLDAGGDTSLPNTTTSEVSTPSTSYSRTALHADAPYSARSVAHESPRPVEPFRQRRAFVGPSESSPADLNRFLDVHSNESGNESGYSYVSSRTRQHIENTLQNQQPDPETHRPHNYNPYNPAMPPLKSIKPRHGESLKKKKPRSVNFCCCCRKRKVKKSHVKNARDFQQHLAFAKDPHHIGGVDNYGSMGVNDEQKNPYYYSFV